MSPEVTVGGIVFEMPYLTKHTSQQVLEPLRHQHHIKDE